MTLLFMRCAHFDRDIVTGNHVLGWHFVNDDPKIDAHHLLHQRHKQEESGPFRTGVAAKREDDTAFVLAQDAHRPTSDAT
jgi:hypothetical protein